MGSAEHQQRGMSGSGRKVLGPPPYTAAPQGAWGAHQLQSSRSTNLVDRDVAEMRTSSPGRGLKGWIRQIKAPQTPSGTVAKLTARGEQAPKLKYLNKVADPERLLAGADATEVLAELNKRPVQSNPLVALKACVLLHHVMHSGAGDGLSAAYNQLPLLQELRATYSKSPANPDVSFSSLIAAYSSLLSAKAKFHHRFLSFEADYSVDFKTYRSGNSGNETRNPLSLAAVEALSTSLSLSLSCASLCLHHLHLKGAGGVEGLLVAVTIPILREADLVHSCVWRILDLLQQGCTILQLSAEGLGAAQALALLHHSALRVLYDRVRKNPALAMQGRPPVLPEQPPCLAPPPFISTDSLPKDWYWPGELSAEEQKVLEQEREVATIGGVGAAMEAAMQRHAAGQAEARRMQPPSPAASSGHSPSPSSPAPPPDTTSPHLHLQPPQVPGEGQLYLQQMLQQRQVTEQQQRMLQTAQFADLVAHSPYKPQQTPVGPPLNHPAHPAPPVPPTPPQPEPTRQPRETSPVVSSEWEIPFSELRLGPVVGRGAFGDVVHGSWQGTEVAVKCLQNLDPQAYQRAAADFQREMALVCRLRHPNVVLFMGACTKASEASQLCIVMEYAARGSLYGVLRDTRLALDWPTVLRWALEAARGINYLHTRTPPICHRDLKSGNLLVDMDWHIKVSDFGLARTKANSSTQTQTQVGTWAWMAPEVLEQRPYDEKADVYSYGVILWELFTREEPFKDLHPMQIMRAIDRGERPFLPPACPPVYRHLVYDCWQTNPRLRPSFQHIIDRLVPLQQLQQPYTTS